MPRAERRPGSQPGSHGCQRSPDGDHGDGGEHPACTSGQTKTPQSGATLRVPTISSALVVTGLTTTARSCFRRCLQGRSNR
jgi:hypothetical protein